MFSCYYFSVDKSCNKDHSQSLRYPSGIYVFKVNNAKSKTMREICSKLTVKAPEWRTMSSYLWRSKYQLDILYVYTIKRRLNTELSQS